MNIVLWIIQGLLGAMMLAAGGMKASQSKEKLLESGDQMAWANDVSASNIKVIGVLELLAGLGLILPQLTGILPWLTPLAAVGVILTMIGAMTLHIKRGDPTSSLVTNAVILAVAAFVAYGRFVLVPA